MLKGLIPTLRDPLGAAKKSFPGYLEGFGQPEVGPGLSQFSVQWTPTPDWTDADIDICLDLASLPGAVKMITFFGARAFGKIAYYSRKRGYDPGHIREIERSHCGPLDPNELPSMIFGAHNMNEYGSGGLPEFLRPYRVVIRAHSAPGIDAYVLQYVGAKFFDNTIDAFQWFKARSRRLTDLAWCRTTRSIQTCWHVATTLDRGIWLLKMAVYAACTLERAKSGDISFTSAAITLLQLYREIGDGLCFMVLSSISTSMAAVAALLMETAIGFINAGLCLITTKEHDAAFTALFFSLAEACACYLVSVTSTVSAVAPWKELATICIKETNFCPSRPINIVMHLQK